MNRDADTTESFAAGRSEFLAVLVDVDFHHFASHVWPTQANVVLAGRGRNLKHASRDHLRIARILDLDAIKYPPLQKRHLVAVLRFLIGVKKKREQPGQVSDGNLVQDGRRHGWEWDSHPPLQSRPR